MSYFDAILLGIIQGLTEFLPVSSSGHLVLAQQILGVKQAGVSFELLTHLGTLGAVLVYFRGRLFRIVRSLFDSQLIEDRKMIAWLALGSVPAGVIGLSFDDFFEEAFSSPALASAMLIVTGLILVATRWVRIGQKQIGWKASLVMGLGQAAAIMPGISRSGTTIAAGLATGVEPARVAEFSFLLAIPAIAGATLLKAGDLMHLDAAVAGPYLAGTAVAFASGLLSVYAVLATIRKGKFQYFGFYCFAAGALGLYLFL